MGITGHIGVLFERADRSAAIEAVTGVADGDEASWFKENADFRLIREDWWEMHRTLESLADLGPDHAPLARLLYGGRIIGEGPGTPMYHYQGADLAALAKAAACISENELATAVTTALGHPDFAEWLDSRPEHKEALAKHLQGAFAHLRSELQRIAATGCEMIGFMF